MIALSQSFASHPNAPNHDCKITGSRVAVLQEIPHPWGWQDPAQEAALSIKV